MSRNLITLMLCIFLALPAAAQNPRPLGQAMDAMRAGNWENAVRLAERDGAVAADILEWHRLRAGRGTYQEVQDFLASRPDWPGLELLRRKSEPVVVQQSDADVLAFFEQGPPQTASGVLAYAGAMTAQGNKTEAQAQVVRAWRSMRMSAEEQALFLGRYETLLKKHNVARLDYMLWRGWTPEASRMTALVPKDWQALSRARIALRNNAEGVNALIDKVPANLKSNPGLAFDRFDWRARKGLDTAIDLLLERSKSAESLGRPEAWASRRRILARAQMRAGNSKRAYRIAAENFMTEGSNFADLEWLAGYIALRKLNDPATALAHFKRFDAAVASPISKGRAAYWTGRAYHAMGNEAEALEAYTHGAQYQTSFYGLLSAEAAGLPFDDDLTGDEPFGPWRDAEFTHSSLYEAGILLLASGEMELAERFFTHLAESLPRSEAGKLGQMALDLGEPHLAVMIGKRVASKGTILPAPYYALHPVQRLELPMAPEMVLSIARRESEFNPVVVSGAGARGLMQIMPATASELAESLGRGYEHSTDRLVIDWEYNAQLGATFLSRLAGRFDGNVVMMSAAYNAGPGRPIRWMKEFGDPRQDATPQFDVIDWIEHIPFRETQNYVMRVAESLPIYRARLGLDPLPIPFSQELTGSTLSAFAPKGE